MYAILKFDIVVHNFKSTILVNVKSYQQTKTSKIYFSAVKNASLQSFVFSSDITEYQ